MQEPFVHKLLIQKKEETASRMQPIEEQIWLSEHGLMGDAVEQRAKDQAVFAYPIQHYTYWQEVVAMEHVNVGTLGENFSVLEMDEYTVCIGDIYTFGDAVIQVSQPFLPPRKLGEMIGFKDVRNQIHQTGRSGWYFRVLQEGYVLSRIDIELVERPYPEWSIAACQEIAASPVSNLRRTHQLLSCDALAKRWKRPLRKKAFGRP